MRNTEATAAFAQLRQELTDLVRESQIKLGVGTSAIRFFYPVESLNRMLGTALTADEMQEALEPFTDFCADSLGAVDCVRTEDRFCFVIPAEGAQWVHAHTPSDGFLVEFIAEIARHGSSIKTLLPIFERHSDRVVCQRLNNEEFDYLVYFADGTPDAYRYCIREDLGHATYHRFSKQDYDAFGFSKV